MSRGTRGLGFGYVVILKRFVGFLLGGSGVWLSISGRIKCIRACT
jgi:hypothetical protein